MKECEECGAMPPTGSHELLDYCAYCLKDLCPKCMEKGCCGRVPAVSGMEADNAEDEE